MWAGTGVKGVKGNAAWSLQGCWDKRQLDGAGTLGQKAHSAPEKVSGPVCHPLPLTECRSSPAFLSLYSFSSFPPGLWGCTQSA